MKQPLTAKELEYVVDSMSNEDLLIKQVTALASTTQNPGTHALCMELLSAHNQHYQTMMQSLHQHMPLAPTQPQ